MKNQNLNKIITRIEKIEKAVFDNNGEEKIKNKRKGIKNVRNIDFTLNERTFIKRYSPDKSSGPKKFTLLLAYLVKGEVDKNIKLSEVKKHWNKMKAKSLLGGEFNMFYPNKAKENGWVDSKEYGSYNLTDEWENIIL